MGSNYIFSLTPTFTQGLIIGQLSILLLLALILKYLFLDTGPPPPYDAGPVHFPANTTLERDRKDRTASRTHFTVGDDSLELENGEAESARWFNLVVRQVRI